MEGGGIDKCLGGVNMREAQTKKLKKLHGVGGCRLSTGGSLPPTPDGGSLPPTPRGKNITGAVLIIRQ